MKTPKEYERDIFLLNVELKNWRTGYNVTEILRLREEVKKLKEENERLSNQVNRVSGQ